MSTTESFQQLALCFTDPMQHHYEVIRGIMLADETVAQRSRSKGRLHVAYRETLLAQYAYRYDRTAQRLRAVNTPRLFQTPYKSPQFELWEIDDEQWHKIGRRLYERHRSPPEAATRQLLLPADVLAVS